MILVIIYLLIIVFNLKINTVSSEDEKNIENDFLYSKIRAAVLNGDTVIKQGKKKIINERNCYASMLFTSDEGKIVLNQVVIPGGKKKKLSKAVTENLVKLGLSEGVENGPVVVVVEVGAWWGNKGMIQLGRYKSLINNGLVYICIADHLTKHQGQAFVDTLENQLKTVAYGAATYTCVTQPNDLTANSLLDEGVKCFSEHYILTNGSDIVPSWDIICNLQLTLTNTINETPTYTAAIAKDYSRGGYTLDYEIGHDSEDDKLLHGVEFGGNESFLAGLFPKGVQELIEKYGSPFDAPGAEIAELCKKAGRKDTPDGYAHFHPSVVQLEGYIKEFEKGIISEQKFPLEDKKIWLNQRREQIDIYYDKIIKEDPKYCDLSIDGLTKHAPAISAAVRALIAETAIKKQKLRLEKLQETYNELHAMDNNADDDYAFGGTDLNDLYFSIKSKKKYLEKQMKSRGLWSHKKRGIPNSKKQDDILNQPLISQAFAIVQYNNEQKLLQQRKQQMIDRVLCGDFGESESEDANMNDNHNHNRNVIVENEIVEGEFLDLSEIEEKNDGGNANEIIEENNNDVNVLPKKRKSNMYDYFTVKKKRKIDRSNSKEEAD
eukprot:65646_1